jgi:hypothetical protein
MDNDVIAKLRRKKEVIGKTGEAQPLALVCEQMHSDHWDAYYAACNLHAVDVGTNAGVSETPTT